MDADVCNDNGNRCRRFVCPADILSRESPEFIMHLIIKCLRCFKTFSELEVLKVLNSTNRNKIIQIRREFPPSRNPITSITTFAYAQGVDSRNLLIKNVQK